MLALATPRLLLVPLTRAMIATRLPRDDFTLDLELEDEVVPVHFGPEWPGEALEHYPDFHRHLGDAAYVEGTFVAIERATREAIGQLGTSGAVHDDGAVEIGYGINTSRRGSGFATEAVAAVSVHLLGCFGISRVTARTAIGNVASQRVLEANGFRPGEAPPARDGLLLWVRDAG